MNRFLNLFCIVCFFLSGCGYRFDGARASNAETISVPYVVGDPEGMLTDELVRQLSASGRYRFVQGEGKYTLNVVVISDSNEKIGYRYDRKETGKLEKNLIPTESRRALSAEVSLLDNTTDAIVVGPIVISANSEYDYINSSSLRELGFREVDGRKERVIHFSLGQLDSIEGASDAVLTPLYRRLAQKIVDGISLSLNEISDEFAE